MIKMKIFNYKTLAILMVSLTILIIGCSKDDNKVGNQFTYSNKSYAISYGSLEDMGESPHSPPTYEFDLILATKGITYNTNYLGNYIGTGSFIELNLFSRNPNDLDPGTYVFDGFASGDSLTFDGGSIGINYNLSTGEPDTAFYEIETGAINVVKRGNSYELDFSLYIDGKKEVKGYYLGALEKHVYIDKKKKINLKN